MNRKTGLECLYEDEDVLVCIKPPGMPSQSDKSGDYDLLSHIKNHLALVHPSHKEPYAAIVHRLDRPVGGVMVYAKNCQAAAQLNHDIAKGEIKKRYLAVVSSGKEELRTSAAGMLTDYLVKDGRTNLSRVVPKEAAQAKRAQLRYEVKEETVLDEGKWYLLDIELLTGRHHQIRVQLSEHFGGIWGDTKYHLEFKNRRGWFAIALYSYRLEFKHPTTGKIMAFEHAPDTYPFTSFSWAEHEKEEEI